MADRGKPRGSGVGPYRLFVTLLYGQHKWIDRSDTKIRVPISSLATYMRTRANRIREYLYLLEDWGVLDYVRINQHWVTVQVRLPKNMVWDMGSFHEVEIIEDLELMLPGLTTESETEDE